MNLSFTDTRARKNDPATSHAAAKRAARFATSHAGQILGALLYCGPQTAHELTRSTKLTVVQIDRRLPELKAAGRADVAKHDDGADVVRAGFRVWRAL